MNILYYHISYYPTWVYRVLYFIFGVTEVNSDIMLFSSLLYRPPEARSLLWCHHALMLTCYTMKNSHSNRPKGLKIPS